MAKKDLIAQIAEQNKSNEDLKKMLVAKPLEEGPYIVSIKEYSVNNNRVSISYNLKNTEDRLVGVARESYTTEGIQMLVDKLNTIAYLYNKDNKLPATQEQGIDQLIGYEFAGNLSRRINNNYINWNITPLIPTEEA